MTSRPDTVTELPPIEFHNPYRNPDCPKCHRETAYSPEVGYFCYGCRAYWPGTVDEPGRWFDE